VRLPDSMPLQVQVFIVGGLQATPAGAQPPVKGRGQSLGVTLSSSDGASGGAPADKRVAAPPRPIRDRTRFLVSGDLGLAIRIASDTERPRGGPCVIDLG
jgi:hypothetical protein